VPLDISIPLASLQNEYKGLEDHGYKLKKYQTNYRLVRNYYAKSWSGICLISSDGGLYTDLSEGDIQSSVNEFSDTELVEHCPTFYGLIKQLNCGAHKTRARIMKISPNRSLLWHSHVLEHGQPENILTVQVPLYVPPSFLYCVVDKQEFRWYRRFSSHSKFRTISKVNLKPGRAYIFNSYHYHNVYNQDRVQSRLTLMVYLDLHNQGVFDLVSRSVHKYCVGVNNSKAQDISHQQVEPVLSS
jgi:hypothetical protein